MGRAKSAWEMGERIASASIETPCTIGEPTGEREMRFTTDVALAGRRCIAVNHSVMHVVAEEVTNARRVGDAAPTDKERVVFSLVCKVLCIRCRKTYSSPAHTHRDSAAKLREQTKKQTLGFAYLFAVI